MGGNLSGEDIRIWRMHKEGFCVSSISGLVGLTAAYVCGVITGVWLDDKLETKRAKKS